MLLYVVLGFVVYKFGLPKLIEYLGDRKEIKEKLEFLEGLLDKFYAVALLIGNDETDIITTDIYNIILDGFKEVEEIISLEENLSLEDIYNKIVAKITDYGIEIGNKEHVLVNTVIDYICDYFGLW